MPVIFDSFLIQIFLIFFVIIFSISAFFWPRKTSLLFPIILPFYLIKTKITVAEFVLPVNILDVLMALFLIINWRLIWKGILLIYSRIARITNYELRIKRLFLASVIFLLSASALSSLFAIDQKTALGTAKSWFWLPILLFFALFPFFRSSRYRQNFLFSFFLSGIAMTLMSVPFILQNLYTYDGRLAGISLSPNHLAMALVPGIIALVIQISNIRYQNDNSKFKKACYFLILFLELIVLYLTYSYSTWLALAIAMLPTAYCLLPTAKKLRPRFLAVFSLLIILAISQINNPKLQHIIKGDYYSSFHSRIMIWQSAWKISKDHWLTGVGVGNFQQAYLDYQKYFPEPYIEWAVPMPHNVFLAFQTQLGILGLISFIIILVASLLRVVIPAQAGIQEKNNLKIDNWKLNENCKMKIENFKNSLSRLDSLSLWALAYLVYIIFHGIVDTPYFKNDLAVIFWLALAAIWTAKPNRTIDYESQQK